MSFGFGFDDDDFGFDDDYVDDIIATFFADENGVEKVLDSIIDDDVEITHELEGEVRELHIADIDDIEPTDSELDAIETEIGTASV